MTETRLRPERHDIATTLKVLEALDDVAVFITKSVKEGWRTSSTFKIIQMVSDIAALAQEVDELLPELKDLDKREAEEIAGVVYETVRKIIDILDEED